jgi:predicted nucleotidyltransferase
MLDKLNMEYRRPLDGIFGRPAHVRVLRVLARNPEGLTGRRLAELAALEPSSAHNALKRLVEFGLVDVSPLGRAHVYRLLRDRLAARELLLPLFRKEADLLPAEVRRLAKSFGDLAISVVLFGSVARREEGPWSDLDVCVVVPDAASRRRAARIVDKESTRLSSLTGIQPTFFVVTRRDFQRRFRGKNSLVRSIVREGRVVKGKTITEVLSDGKEA